MSNRRAIQVMVGIGLTIVGIIVTLAYKGDDIGGLFLAFMGTGFILFGEDE